MITDYRSGIDAVYIQSKNANTYLIKSSFDGLSFDYKGYNFALKVELQIKDEEESDEEKRLNDYITFTHEIHINNRDVGNKMESMIEVNFMKGKDFESEQTEKEILREVSTVIRRNLDKIVSSYEKNFPKGTKQEKKVIENRGYAKNVITEISPK